MPPNPNPITFRDVKRGDPLEAARWNQLQDAVR